MTAVGRSACPYCSAPHTRYLPARGAILLPVDDGGASDLVCFSLSCCVRDRVAFWDYWCATACSPPQPKKTSPTVLETRIFCQIWVHACVRSSCFFALLHRPQSATCLSPDPRRLEGYKQPRKAANQELTAENAPVFSVGAGPLTLLSGGRTGGIRLFLSLVLFRKNLGAGKERGASFFFFRVSGFSAHAHTGSLSYWTRRLPACCMFSKVHALNRGPRTNKRKKCVQMI